MNNIQALFLALILTVSGCASSHTSTLKNHGECFRSINLYYSLLNPSVRDKVGGLSPDALMLLLDAGDTGFKYLDADWKTDLSFVGQYTQLERCGFAVVEKSARGDAYPYKMSLTDSGMRTWNSIREIILSLFLENSKRSAEDCGYH